MTLRLNTLMVGLLPMHQARKLLVPGRQTILLIALQVLLRKAVLPLRQRTTHLIDVQMQ